MKKGFSLIEIMIVITIIGLFTGMGALTFKNNAEEKNLKKDAEVIQDILSSAKTKTITREIPAAYTCNPFGGYGVYFNGPGNTYSFWMICPPTSPTLIAYPLKYTTYRTATNIDCRFNYPYGTTTAGCTVSLRNSKISRCMDINVTTNGSVQVGKSYGC